jgi:hypothetical protein
MASFVESAHSPYPLCDYEKNVSFPTPLQTSCLDKSPGSADR